MADKLELKTILAAIDMGSKESWDEFSDEEKKSVGFFLLNRYVSNVKTSNQDLAEHYLILVNEFVNKKKSRDRWQEKSIFTNNIP